MAPLFCYVVPPANYTKSMQCIVWSSFKKAPPPVIKQPPANFLRSNSKTNINQLNIYKYNNYFLDLVCLILVICIKT